MNDNGEEEDENGEKNRGTLSSANFWYEFPFLLLF